MPSNLNALIRYKQIDRCLRNKYVNCTIRRMQEMCTEQLAEYRGIYKLVSERSIRDDIKTMRGDSLGFNAPIVVKNGVYSYSDKSYSIFKTSIDDIELLKKVMLLLIDEIGNITNPNLFHILSDLSEKTGIEIPEEKILKQPVRETDLLSSVVSEQKVSECSEDVSSLIKEDKDDQLGFASSISFKKSMRRKFTADLKIKKSSVSLYNWDEILMLLE